MKKTITTAYIPAKNDKPSRIRCTDGERLTRYYSYHNAPSEVNPHHHFAKVFRDTVLNWTPCKMYAGSLGKDKVVFVIPTTDVIE